MPHPYLHPLAIQQQGKHPPPSPASTSTPHQKGQSHLSILEEDELAGLEADPLVGAVLDPPLVDRVDPEQDLRLPQLVTSRLRAE